MTKKKSSSVRTPIKSLRSPSKSVVTPMKNKGPKSPNASTPRRRSYRLMESFKLPFSCTRDEAISLSEDEAEKQEGNASPGIEVNDQNVVNEVEVDHDIAGLDIIQYEERWIGDDKNVYEAVEPDERRIEDDGVYLPRFDSDVPVKCGVFDSQFSMEDLGYNEGPASDQGTPTELMTPIRMLPPLSAADNLDAEEEYHSGNSTSSDDEASTHSGFERWGWERYEAEENAEQAAEENVEAEENAEQVAEQAAEQNAEQAADFNGPATEVDEDSDSESEERTEEKTEERSDFKKFVEETEDLYGDEEESEELDRQGSQNLEILEKMEWNTMTECRKFLRRHAIFKKFEYKQKKNNKVKIDFRCKEPSCNWRVYVRKCPHDQTARLRFYQPEHSCKSDVKCKNSMADARWVAGEIEDCIRNHKSFKPRDVIAEIWQRYGIKLSYTSAYNARLICHENIYGKYNESYKLCPEICRQILENNHGSVAEWLRHPVDNKFVGVCIAFKASLDGFVNGCRPIIGLDGAFLKGKYGGAVLSAISLDGNNGLFPVAMYVTRGETYDNWSTFLQILKPHLLKHKETVTFISDRCKGLLDAVHDIFPSSPHRWCFRHMYKNFKAKHGGAHMQHLSWGAAKAYKIEEHERWMKQINKDKSDAFDWLNKEDKEGWVRAYFDTTCKCEHITNNFSESFNSMILDLRDMPLIRLIEKFQLMVMSLMYRRRCKARDELVGSVVVPRVEKTIEKLKKQYKYYTTKGTTDWMHVAINKLGVSWTVDLQAQGCSCCEWQISGIPCVHAMAVILPMRDSWEKYCSSYFTVDAYKAAYEGYIHPFEDSKYWKEPQHKVLPPPLYRPPGRPRNNRMKNQDEVLPEKRGQKRCSKCGNLGHNKKSCKGPPAPPTRGRKRTAAEGVNGSFRPAIAIPPPPARRTSLGLRGRGGPRGRGRGRGRTFYPPSSRSFEASSSAAAATSYVDTYNYGRELNSSETNLNM